MGRGTARSGAQKPVRTGVRDVEKGPAHPGLSSLLRTVPGGSAHSSALHAGLPGLHLSPYRERPELYSPVGMSRHQTWF